jgi:phenylpyruvate tautomerase PptA (4-oxalocrotonate tautomerase family)
MPTYVVTTSLDRYTAEQKQKVVETISRIHSEEAGNVPQFLVQVM